MIYINIILPFKTGSSKWPLSLSFPTKSLYTPLLSHIRTTFLACLILLDIITRKILGVKYRSLSFSKCSFLHYPVTSSLLRSNILLSTLFSNTLSLLSSPSVSDQVSHPYKTTGKIIFLYILIIKYLDSCGHKGLVLNNTQERSTEAHWKGVVIPLLPENHPVFLLMYLTNYFRQKKSVEILHPVGTIDVIKFESAYTKTLLFLQSISTSHPPFITSTIEEAQSDYVLSAVVIPNRNRPVVVGELFIPSSTGSF